MDAQTEPTTTAPLTHRETRVIVFGVLLPLFMASLDNTILASALPIIGSDFADVHNLPWLITIYLLAATAGLPLYGKVADIHGRHFTLRIAIAAHLLGSLACALAPSLPLLILARALQGIGGAGLSVTALIVLGDAAGPKDRGRYYAYFATVYTTAGACGPALGGFLAQHLHWSVIFWLNIPLGLITVLITETLLRKLPRNERRHELDVLGAALIVVASVCFMLALNLGGRSYPWLSAPILLLFAAALVIGTGFVWRLLAAREPLIPIAILANPTVRWGTLAHAVGWSSVTGLNIFLPMYLQNAIGLSATEAGLSLMILMVSLNSSAGLFGQLLGRVKHYKVAPMCMMLVAIGAVATLAWRADSMTIPLFQLLLFLIGLGFGPMPSLATVSIQNTVPRHQFGITIGTMNFSRSLFSTMLIALLGAIVLSATAAVDPGAAAVANGTDSAAAAQAFRRVFLTITACFVVSFVAIAMLEERPLRTRDDL